MFFIRRSRHLIVFFDAKGYFKNIGNPFRLLKWEQDCNSGIAARLKRY